MPRRNVIVGSLFAAVIACAAVAQAAVAIDWVGVGNANNASDPTTGFGAVDHDFRIAKYEVTNAQYTEFLNTVDAGGVNALELYSNYMGSTPNIGGIGFSAGAAAGSKYTALANMGDRPVVFVSFLSAMRFANWMHNGQASGGTETGAYTVVDGIVETRNANATYFLPSEDEWYKAAYHQPAGDGGDADDYWKYATAGNTLPTAAVGAANGDVANPGANVANWNAPGDPSGNTRLTNVATAGVLSESFYGTADQSGNAAEWTEGFADTAHVGISRVLRGGQWNNTIVPSDDVRASYRTSWFVTAGGNFSGFRVAAAPIPEPTSITLLIAGSAMLLHRRRRSR